MNLRKIFITLSMGIVILLPSATAFVPVTYADPGGGGGIPVDPCANERVALAVAASTVKGAKKDEEDARQYHVDKFNESYAANKLYEALSKLLKYNLEHEVHPEYFPYSSMLYYELALEMLKNDKDAKESASSAATIAWLHAIRAHELARADYNSALSALTYCISQHKTL